VRLERAAAHAEAGRHFFDGEEFQISHSARPLVCQPPLGDVGVNPRRFCQDEKEALISAFQGAEEWPDAKLLVRDLRGS
jgi:hypothetical protein